MEHRQLKRLSKLELLNILISLRAEHDALEAENEQLKARIEELTKEFSSQKAIIKEAGTLAEAALELNHIFEVAQAAADEYVELVKVQSHERGTLDG